YCFSYKTPFA
ncbi:hypothetical protein CP8484711_1304B, partial [Chlamydia psittaci 84-8471/1]